ncbi:MAG: hypothetical protein A3A96_02345 [Candidatus Zambryskibacteria bacterium RIFCSPLOWO2_01_FULL_39_39]|uniref:Restriction endonuclease subunit R n=1 Tax=Candidatus Zambryskibacteria bacterium RIFCSPLOWO2_01_FULL_39_39 TaxID=1802758 RepID=A0A1G2TZV0_9BACT|nr:MAG: Type III restriction enzyme, res subunit:DEAD/DEAH box helicase [Parcubacteria group bacterium GW2011_GWA1_38_7]OHA86530.1 MAG: hypothetical protein A2644_00595 [Candidatus Zambryskibacteria bacterium RIFCSPHIGHO2_01_FULL_39_63]OHA94793.1 MAG: hypothetical protein A3B88_04105 [Candidatus Zambryskibacteria bacterium RIFCSPHIGHO2_02_FULL_39_19]OHA98283.1 MAG: hypothetical protein A3F20_01795 [Candidatus Zambryskibacteria bacterium RIFCSPHIGHO2_12_FULL_39_21]OHB02669.1 MAG: hypothetical pr
MIQISDDQINLYLSIFKGRSDIYARHWEKNGRSGYSPAYSFNWDEFLIHKQKGGTINSFGNKKLIPLTKDIIKKHLLGVTLLGIYPILEDNTSYFIAADFDGENWLEDSRKYIDVCKKVGLTTYLERSKSGNGGHVWIFFQEAYPCYKSRAIATELIRQALDLSVFEKEVSFDRLFPNQDSIPQGGFGNLIAFPLQGKYLGQGNSAFIDPYTVKLHPDQWEFLSKIHKHTTEELDKIFYEVTDNEKVVVQKRKSADRLVITVGKNIQIPRSELAPATVTFLKEKLNFLSTEYLTRKRLGKSVYKVQKYFKLIEESGDNIFLPRGFLNQLTSFLESNGIKYEVNCGYPEMENVKFKSLIKLTPHQEEALEKSLKQTQGVIVAPPGSGKTMIGMELIAKRELPALVLAHRKQLLDQWVDRIQTYLNIPKIKIGTFSGSRKKIGKEITVALMQSLARYKNIAELENKFGTIIVDECHHIPAKTFREVIANLNSQYLYGLTATPKRKHNDEQLIYVYIGDIITEMAGGNFSEENTENTSSNKLKVVIKETDLEIPFQWKTDRFQLLAKIISFDTARNKLVTEDILEQVKVDNKILVLSERKEHLEILELCLKGKCETIVISGDDSASKRTSKLKQINDGHYNVILSTGQFFGEGLDIKNISTLVLAFPFSFEGKLIQYIGRLLHSANPKFVFDYRDKKIAFLERQFKQRNRYYKKLI